MYHCADEFKFVDFLAGIRYRIGTGSEGGKMKKSLHFACCAVLLGIAALVAGCAPQDLPFPAAALAKDTHAMVRVFVFNKEGELVGPLETPKLTLTAAEWRKRLTAEQFKVLRSSDTERPFCGLLLDNKEAGVYTCAGCGLPLFSSDSKFHSGTGWPSFFQPIAKGNVAERVDRSHGMVRKEINCGRCDGHLGHVFDDGPKPTGLRFCLNSASLKFTPSEKLKDLADPLAEKKDAKPSAGDSSANDGNADDGPMATAVVAGGCFWCTEAAFEQLDGVSDVESVYTGGTAETANYNAVCSGRTGHAEAIRITYNPKRISYDQLLDVFFDAHDPTQLNAQGTMKEPSIARPSSLPTSMRSSLPRPRLSN